MRTFICEFRTTNEILFKERNNSLNELRFEVQELLKVIDNTPMTNCEIKGVTTRGGKTTSHDVQTNSTNVHAEEPLVTEKRKRRRSAVLLNKLPSKEKDPESFTIPYDIDQLHINNALADLGASISLMPYTMYEKLGLGEPTPTRISLELADRSIQYPRGIIENVLIKVDKFVLPIDFVILDMPEDSRVPIILGRPFLATSRAMIDVFNKKITLRVGDDELLENDRSDLFLLKGLEKSIDHSDLESRESLENKSDVKSDLGIAIRRIDYINTSYSVEQRTSRPDEVKSEHFYSASANEIDEKRPELKSLPNHLEYVYLHGNKLFPIIISSKLFEKEKNLLLQVLEKHRGAIAWKMPDIKGISPSFCTHKILMEDDFKPVIQTQRRLNPKDQDVVKNKIVKLLDSGLIYPIPDSSMLARCEETNLVLNWEKCHFMVKEGIVLRHKISGAGIEVDRAKIDVIAKLPYLTNVKGVRSFLGHARFYRSKQDAKPRLVRMVLLLQGFNIEIKDKKRAENLAADHLSRLENLDLGTFTEEEIMDEFPDEHLMILKAELNDDEPWYTDCVNYIVGKIPFWTNWDSASITGRKVYESGFFWPSIFKDAKDYIMRCDACQRSGNISSRSEMPQNNIQVCDVFDICGLDFMGPFPNSRGNKYILVAVDYVSKWVEAQALPINDARVVIKFLRKLFVRFGIPKALITYKTPTGCTPFRLVYGKACHLPVEIEHRAYWALKQCNIDLTAAAKNRFMELNELMELRDGEYKNTRIYKKRTKEWHDSRL
ncbi:reverse transcriptase domain-containing protein [Tanacetum coccineum]